MFAFFRHGLGRTDFYILNDPELSFRDTVNKNVMSAVSGSNVLKTEYVSNPAKLENVENGDIVRVDQNQIIVKLEKGEGTLQIEKVSTVKKESVADEPVSVDIALVKTEPEDAAALTPTPVRVPTPIAEKSVDEPKAPAKVDENATEESVEPKEEPKEDAPSKENDEMEVDVAKDDATPEVVGRP